MSNHKQVSRYLPYARIQSEIKRANRRIAQVAETYGTNSKIYQSMIEPFQNLAYQQYTHAGRNTGVLQISNKPYNLMTSDRSMLSKDGRLILQLARNVMTVKQLRQQAREYARQYMSEKEVKQLTNLQLDELLENMKFIETEFESVKQEFYDRAYRSEIDEMLSHPDEKWSYSDLQRKINEMREFIKAREERNKIERLKMDAREGKNIPFTKTDSNPFQTPFKR